MKTNKQLGIYLDYTHAFLMEFENELIVSRDIEFEFDKKSKADPDNDDELAQRKEKHHHLQPAYFFDICDIIKNYNQVVLFGPNDAKDELFNLLGFDRDFKNMKIQNIDTDKMTDVQIHDFVKEYYK